MSLRHQLSLVGSFQRRYGCCTVAGGDRLCGPGVDLILNTFRPFKAWVMSRSSGGHGLADTCTLFRLLLLRRCIELSIVRSLAWATVWLWIWLRRRKMGLLSEKWTLIFVTVCLLWKNMSFPWSEAEHKDVFHEKISWTFGFHLFSFLSSYHAVWGFPWFSQ